MTADVLDETARWKAWRRGGVTATDVAAAVSGAYGGIYGVVADKLGIVTDDQPETDDQARGKKWEDPLAQAAEALTGYHVVYRQAWAEHPDHPRHRATIDGALAETPDPDPDRPGDILAGLETKTRRRGLDLPWDAWDAQVQWQMWVTGFPRVLALSGIIGHDTALDSLRMAWIDENFAKQAALVELADRILDHVDAGTLPDPADASALDVVKAVWARADDDPEPVDIEDLADVLDRYATLHASIAAAQAEHDQLAAVIRHRIGAQVEGHAPGWRVKVGRPAQKLTAETEALLFLRFPWLAVHPDTHQTELVRAKPIKKAVDAYREPVGARTLTVTRLEVPTP